MLGKFGKSVVRGLAKFEEGFRSLSGDLNTRIEDQVTDATSYGGLEGE